MIHGKALYKICVEVIGLAGLHTVALINGQGILVAGTPGVRGFKMEMESIFRFGISFEPQVEGVSHVRLFNPEAAGIEVNGAEINQVAVEAEGGCSLLAFETLCQINIDIQIIILGL
ncbi:hypothetical protein ES708_34788 [subsurface metagenome]